MAQNERRNLLKAALIAMGGAAAVGIGVYSCGAYCYSPAALPNPTRQELVKRLERLAQSKPPKVLRGAMCYDMAPLIIQQGSCPDCKCTMIVGEKEEILSTYNVPFKRVQDHGIQAKLIIPDHCPSCGDGLKDKPFQLEIKYSDQPDPVRVELENAHDLELMALFLQGKDRGELSGQHTETPLKDKLDRLRELFGVKQEQQP